MKKLMIVAAAICVAIGANAATVNWASGALQTPGADGALSGSKITSSSGFTVAMYAFESLSAISYESGDLLKWYQTDSSAQFKGLDAITGTVNMGASSTTATARGAISEDAGTTVYAAVLFVLSDATTGEAKWYIENSASKETAKAAVNVSNLGLKVGGTGAATSWTAVPEPTSGLLMLLGMAGLALRRRRA